MSDSLSEFRRKSDAMFDRTIHQVEEIGRVFITLAATDVILTTRGFGNQRPDDTKYIPTGRLRGGWNWSATKPPSTRFDGGPYSDYGYETVDRVTAQIASAPILGVSFIANDVAYGEIVRIGGGNHQSQDTWLLDTQNRMDEFAREARLTVMRGGL